MPRQTFYNPSDRLTNGQVPQDSDWNSRLFDAPQAEYELRDLPFRGFYEVPVVTIAGLTANLTFPLGQGGLLAGIRLATSGQWVFSSQAAGTYVLQLDHTNAFQLNAMANAAQLSVATVHWDGSNTLSALTLDPLAANAPTVKINNEATAGAGTVTQVNGVNPDGSGHVTLGAGAVGAEPALGNPTTLSGILTSTEAGVRSWMQLAWNMLLNIPSAFTPSAHATMHGSSGSDPLSPASIGALASSALVQSVGNPGSGSAVPSEAAVCAAIAAGVSGTTNGLTYKGTWNASTNTPALASSTGTLGWFYKVSVAGTTTVDGNNVWQVGDIMLFDGMHWDRVAGYEAVTAVFGRTGPVVAATGDYDVSQIAFAAPPSAFAGLWTSLGNALTSIAGFLSSFNGANKLVQLDGSARYPALNGSQITNLTAAQISGLSTGQFIGYVSTVSVTPPSAPGNGMQVIINGTPAAGAFYGHANTIASYSGGNWSFTAFVAGFYCYALDTGYLWQFNGVSWIGYQPQALLAGSIVTTLPGSPTSGQAVLYVGTGSYANNLAIYNGALWTYIPPQQGMQVLVGPSPANVYLFDNAAWVLQLSGAANQFPTFPLKAMPTTNDLMLIEDAAGGGAKKYCPISDLPISSVPSGPNLLINGGFHFFQRQTPGTATSWASGAYGPDRWYTLNSYGSITMQQVAGSTSQYAATLNNPNPTMDVCCAGIAQVLEAADAIPLRGKTVTFSVQVSANASKNLRVAVLEWTGTADAPTKNVVNNWFSTDYTAGNFFLASNVTVDAVSGTIAASSTAQTVTLSATVSSACNNLYVFVWTEEPMALNTSFTVEQADLYVGTVARAWQPTRTYAQELAICQRYYEKTNSMGYAPGTATGTDALLTSLYDLVLSALTVGNTLYSNLTHLFMTQKRVTPTVKIWSPYSGTLNALYIPGYGVDCTGTTMTVYGISPQGITQFSLSNISHAIGTGQVIAFIMSADSKIGV